MNWREHKDAAEAWLAKALDPGQELPEFCAAIAQAHAILAVAELIENQTRLMNRGRA